MTPDLALQQAVRAMLIADPVIAQLVAPERIRAGSIRPEHLPAIVLAPARMDILGRTSGGQIAAAIRMTVHVWAVQDGSETGNRIAAAAMVALMDAPRGDAFQIDGIDGWDRPALVWMPDPDPALSCAHGAIGLRAVLRWQP